MIPKSFIEEVKRRTEIVPLIREFMPLDETSGGLKGTCPFCRQYDFAVSPGKNIFKCFKCQKGGGALVFVQLTQKKSFVEALEFLAQRLKLERPAEG